MKLFPLFFTIVAGQMVSSLRVELHPTRLPLPMYLLSPMYDGDDTIYIIGGGAEIDDWIHFFRDIYKFSITTGVIKTAKAKTPKGYIMGNSVSLGNGSVLHFGGSPDYFYLDYKEIIRFDQNPDGVTLLDVKLPNDPLYLSPYVIEREETIYFFAADEAYSYNLSSGTFRVDSPEYFSSSFTSTLIGSKIFRPSHHTGKIHGLLKTFLPKNPWNHSGLSSQPFLKGFYTYDYISKQKAFVPVPYPPNCEPLIVGSDTLGNIWTLCIRLDDYWDYFFEDFIYRYNIFNGTLDSFEVEGLRQLPVDVASGVYVSKQNKIYIFGGGTHRASGEGVAQSDEIWTIDLPI